MSAHPAQFVAREALREGAGLPLGGGEETGGYKGFGLALMVEVDTGFTNHNDISLVMKH